ncbi:MAG: hypothetical protein JWM97_2534 [Phycisphaerales bacterium]|nr:hypothetical protein [Phycisphaerales bacterium]MDB5304985.1 hypothetical protein [Phycisphaerales bacterium]
MVCCSVGSGEVKMQNAKCKSQNAERSEGVLIGPFEVFI